MEIFIQNCSHSVNKADDVEL
uniref:Uncharacterized protein n=1 Tax=Tetranychus urticae TaxID=32264 RepID=T1JZP2_TETUR